MVKLTESKPASKARIRKDMLTRLRQHTKKQRTAKSDKIKRRLFKEKYFKQAATIMCYVSKPYEVDTYPIIEGVLKSGKRLIVPVTKTQEKILIPSEISDLQKDLEQGPFGICEPKKECMKTVDLKDIDLVLIPGIAFDRQGNRIGHGQGYFDRFLSNLPNKIPTIGLAFKLQLVSRINALPWDIPVTKLITE
jgi:5-formyltetrahydrofolate cyclo-ligase